MQQLLLLLLLLLILFRRQLGQSLIEGLPAPFKQPPDVDAAAGVAVASAIAAVAAVVAVVAADDANLANQEGGPLLGAPRGPLQQSLQMKEEPMGAPQEVEVCRSWWSAGGQRRSGAPWSSSSSSSSSGCCSSKFSSLRGPSLLADMQAATGGPREALPVSIAVGAPRECTRPSGGPLGPPPAPRASGLAQGGALPPLDPQALSAAADVVILHLGGPGKGPPKLEAPEAERYLEELRAFAGALLPAQEILDSERCLLTPAAAVPAAVAAAAAVASAVASAAHIYSCLWGLPETLLSCCCCCCCCCCCRYRRAPDRLRALSSRLLQRLLLSKFSTAAPQEAPWLVAAFAAAGAPQDGVPWGPYVCSNCCRRKGPQASGLPLQVGGPGAPKVPLV
ncbi:hypothetical protein Emed_002889 [Eimeria media]